MINRSVFFLLAALLLAACSGQKQDSQNAAQDSSAVSLTTVETENKVAVKKDSTVPAIMEGHELPEDCFFTGNFKEAWTWYDLNGKNILLLSSYEKSWKEEETDETANTKELYARHYIQKESGSELLWELYDLEKDCIFDLTAEFLFSPQFTDIDKDGIKESTLAYKLACRSDVSPARMKIVMHENENKYALRGIMYIPMHQQGDPDTTDYSNWQPDLSKLKVKKDDYAGYWGRYENAKDFASAPPSFLENAKQLWLDNFVEKF
jgi:hypothetical protein